MFPGTGGLGALPVAPLRDAAELAASGYRLVLVPVAPLLASAHALRTLFATLARDGGTRAASWLDAFFELAGRGTTVRREVLAGATTFVTHGPGKADGIAVWGWIWADEAKVDPHRYWGALFQWSPKSRVYRCVSVHQTKRKGKEGEREILRLLGVPAKLTPRQD